MTDDAHAFHAKQRRAAVLGIIQLSQRRANRLLLHPLLDEHANHQRCDCLVELENDIADETVTHHDIQISIVTRPRGQVASFAVAEKIQTGFREQRVRFLRDRVALLRLFANAEQADGGIRASEDVLCVDRANTRKLHELIGRAIDVGAGIQHDDRSLGGRKNRGDRGALESRMQPEQQHRCGHLCAGVARGDECIGLSVLLQPQADHH